MDATIKKQLEVTACKVRKGVIEGVYNAKSGHPGGSLSISDLLTYLYFAKLNIDPKNPKMPQRDTVLPHFIPFLRREDIFLRTSLKSFVTSVQCSRVTRI